MRGKTYRRFSTEFKLGVVEAYLAGEGSLKGLATKAGVDHSLVHYWLKKYHAGELSLDLQREKASVETAQYIAALERKVGQLTMELDLLKRGLIAAPRDEQRAVVAHLRTGGLGARRGCRMNGLPRSTYYRRPRERDAQTSDPDADLRAAFARMQRDFPGSEYRRITRELGAGPHRATHKRVQRVMQAMLHPPAAHRRPWVVAEPDAVSGAWYPNLRAGLRPTGPNQLWVADITYVRLDRGFLFLAVVLDVFSRKVIGYTIGPTLDARLPLAALDATIETRNPPPGCIHHLDRGSPIFVQALP